MTRPARLYRHVFTREGQTLEIHRAGVTPCAAKNAAYTALEAALDAQGLPRTGWRLVTQQDVTYTLPPRPNAKPFPRR